MDQNWRQKPENCSKSLSRESLVVKSLFIPTNECKTWFTISFFQIFIFLRQPEVSQKWQFICFLGPYNDKFAFLVNKQSDKVAWSLNPIQDGLFWSCSRMGGGQKRSPGPLSKICQTYHAMMKFRSFEKYVNHVTHSLSSVDISIFSLEISKFCYIKKYRYRLYFDT